MKKLYYILTIVFAVVLNGEEKYNNSIPHYVWDSDSSNVGQTEIWFQDWTDYTRLFVKSIKDTIDWYKKNSSCEVSYQDDTWAPLKYENISLALVLPNSHPPHIAFEKDDAHKYGELKLHRDGTSSVYVRDPSNNAVEMLKINK